MLFKPSLETLDKFYTNKSDFLHQFYVSGDVYRFMDTNFIHLKSNYAYLETSYIFEPGGHARMASGECFVFITGWRLLRHAMKPGGLHSMAILSSMLATIAVFQLMLSYRLATVRTSSCKFKLLLRTTDKFHAYNYLLLYPFHVSGDVLQVSGDQFYIFEDQLHISGDHLQL